MAVGTDGPAVHRREPAGRRRRYRHRSGRARASRRLHAPHRPCGQRDQRDAARTAQFQSRPRYRAGRRHGPRAQRHGGESSGSGQDRSGVHRLCQSQSGQAQFCFGRQRQLPPRHRRDVQDDGRHRHGPRAVSRRSARDDRPARRPGPGHVRHHTPVDRVHQGRQASRAGGDHGDALGGAAGRALDQRVRAAVRSGQLVGRRRPEGHAP